MSIPGDASPLLLGGGAQQYKIERSLRFNSSDSAFCSRTPASAGNRKTWTYSFWLKRTNFGAIQSYLFSGQNASGDSYVFFNTTDTFAIGTFGSGAWTWLLESSAVFRDSSAWYHFVASIDTTQATASERAKIYVNGSQITAFSTSTYPSQNFEGQINNNAFQNKIGADAVIRYSSGYLADIHFIDGQALTPSSFAETNITTGQWVPKAYTGTYGTNGFRLAFADNSNNTATTLGKDTSGNGNNWTPNNLSVTAGAGNDSLVDTPTSYGTDTGAGGEVRGNYATLNSIVYYAGQVSISDGALSFTSLVSNWNRVVGTISVSSGKWYWEYTPANALEQLGGIQLASASAWFAGSTNWVGWDANSYGYFSTNGNKYNNNVASSYGSSYTTNDVIGVALNLDAGTLTFYKNGVSQGTAFSGLSGTFVPAFSLSTNGGANVCNVNFGQRPFAYTAPSGFKALCDTNLPAPVVAKPNTVMDVATYTGDNTNNRTITTSNSSLKSGLVWIKSRSAAYNHILFDSLRGTGNYLATSSTGAENYAGSLSWTNSGPTGSNSFKVDYGTNPTLNELNSTYVGWVFDAGSSTVTNTQGSITSQVRANASAGFSVVTYTGDRTSAGNSTIGHGLGVAPSLVITKSRSNSSRWVVQHVSLDSDDYLSLNTTDAVVDSVAVGAGALPKPTSTVFYGSWLQGLNNNGETFVAYCFAPVAGYSSFGSYTGNGSTDGPFVYTGFRPRWVLVKAAPGVENWYLVDALRSSSNPSNDYLLANSAGSEVTYNSLFDFVSNGFKIRGAAGANNAVSTTYIYAAFAESPFQYARAR